MDGVKRLKTRWTGEVTFLPRKAPGEEYGTGHYPMLRAMTNENREGWNIIDIAPAIEEELRQNQGRRVKITLEVDDDDDR